MKDVKVFLKIHFYVSEFFYLNKINQRLNHSEKKIFLQHYYY